MPFKAMGSSNYNSPCTSTIRLVPAMDDSPHKIR